LKKRAGLKNEISLRQVRVLLPPSELAPAGIRATSIRKAQTSNNSFGKTMRAILSCLNTTQAAVIAPRARLTACWRYQ
jgi:hypothetical protein